MTRDAALVALLREAFAALQSGRVEDALRLSTAATARAPQDFDAWRIRALVHERIGQPHEQRAALERACAISPGDPAAAFDLGSLLLQRGEAASAARLLRIAMDAPQRDARAAFRYGTAQALLGAARSAVNGFEQATQREPTWIEAWLNLAAMRVRAGDIGGALGAADVALQLQPDNAHAHHTLSAVLSHRFDAASLSRGWAHAEVALEQLPGRADVHCDASILLRKLGRNDEARRHAQAAVAIAPRDPRMVETLGEQLLINRDAAAAVALYAGAIHQGLDSALLHRQHGIALLQAGDPHAAADALRASLALAPGDQRTIAHLGLALAHAGNVDAAVDLLGLQRHVHAVQLGVPAGYGDIDAFNAELARDIAVHPRQRWEPAGLAAHQAHLSGELRDAPTRAIAAFEAVLRDALAGFIARCARDAATAPDDVFLCNVPRGDTVLHTWATQAAGAGFIGTHIHEDSWLSGAYYVAVPGSISDSDPTHAGWIEFGRPYATLPAFPEHALRHIAPRPGTLLLFPSYLFHRTLPHASDDARVSISFDLRSAASDTPDGSSG